MKKVIITYEAIVDEAYLRDEDDILSEYGSLEDAASLDGLDGLIDGSYEYTTKVSIVEANGEHI